MIKKILLALVLLGLLGAGYAYYQVAVAPVTTTDTTVTIPAGSSYEVALDSLAAAGVTVNRGVFDPLAERMAYRREEMRSGRFALPAGLSSLDLIRKLRGGPKETVNVVLTTEREPMNVAAKAARFLDADSLSIQTLFQDRAYLQSLGYTPETFMTLFIPNTYEMYWDATPRQFVDRMVTEHKRFWDANDRRAKAKARGLSPEEVYTLASIVEKETLVRDEQPTVAGVYLNRLERGIPLQADPTAVFATRDFGVKRVLFKHTEFDSPYNTYVYAGLPPGPIAMPSVNAIDAVLSPENHEYIYFCSRGDTSGRHNFAKTLEGHNANIREYVATLKRRGLR